MTASLRNRRLLIVVAVAAITVAGLRVVWWASAWQERSRLVASTRLGELERVRQAISFLPQARDSFQARARRFVDLAPLLIEGESPAAATSALASLIWLAADRAETVRLGALQLRSDTNAAPVFGRIVAYGDLTGDVRGVMRFLTLLEAGPPLLAVRQLSIEQPEPGAPPDRPETLSARFVIEGLGLPGRPRPEP